MVRTCWKFSRKWQTFMRPLSRFIPLVSFYAPWQYQKTRGFLKFSGGYRKRPEAWKQFRETQPYTYRAGKEVFEFFHRLRIRPNKWHISQSHHLKEWEVTLPNSHCNFNPLVPDVHQKVTHVNKPAALSCRFV